MKDGYMGYRYIWACTGLRGRKRNAHMLPLYPAGKTLCGMAISGGRVRFSEFSPISTNHTCRRCMDQAARLGQV